MNTLKTFHVCISSHVNNLGQTVNQIIHCLQRSIGTIQEDVLFDLKVILNELILNAIKHGNKEDASKKVRIAYGIINGDRVFFIIEDEGVGHDYQCLVKDQIEDFCSMLEMRETGRGILIVKGLCDKLKFNQKGNKVVVVKKLTTKPSAHT